MSFTSRDRQPETQKELEEAYDSIWAGEVSPYFTFNKDGEMVEINNSSNEDTGSTLQVASIDPVNKVVTVTERAMEANIGTQVDELTGEAAAKTAVTFTKEEEAAARFLYLLPYVKKFASAMNQKGVIRVMHALAEFPLQESKIKLLNQQEKQLFEIFQEVTAAKSIVLKHALEQQKQTPVTTGEGETNGTN